MFFFNKKDTKKPKNPGNNDRYIKAAISETRTVVLSAPEFKPIQYKIMEFEKNPNKDITDLIFKDLSCISLYWNSDIRILSESLKNDIAIQGNLDPKVLGKSDETIQEEVRKICSIMKEYPGFIFNLGHGITPDIEPAKVEVMIKTIREDI